MKKDHHIGSRHTSGEYCFRTGKKPDTIKTKIDRGDALTKPGFQKQVTTL